MSFSFLSYNTTLPVAGGLDSKKDPSLFTTTQGTPNLPWVEVY